MTTPREIIAQIACECAHEEWTDAEQASWWSSAAARIEGELSAASYRILGPDEAAAADGLIVALRRYGFPVSDAAEPALMEGGSREARALHKAAKAFIGVRSLKGGRS